MAQKENDKGFYIFALGSVFMLTLAILFASAFVGGALPMIFGASAILLVMGIIYFFPKIKLG